MREALHEASLALREGDLPIGAVVVNKNKIVARGRNRRINGHFLRHAEIEAIFSIDTIFEQRESAAIFTTVEPCYLCFGAILTARIGNIYFSAPDKLSGCRQIKDRCEYSCSRIFTLTGGVLEHDSFELLYQHSKERCQLLFGDQFYMHQELQNKTSRISK